MKWNESIFGEPFETKAQITMYMNVIVFDNEYECVYFTHIEIINLSLRK